MYRYYFSRILLKSQSIFLVSSQKTGYFRMNKIHGRDILSFLLCNNLVIFFPSVLSPLFSVCFKLLSIFQYILIFPLCFFRLLLLRLIFVLNYCQYFILIFPLFFLLSFSPLCLLKDYYCQYFIMCLNNTLKVYKIL